MRLFQLILCTLIGSLTFLEASSLNAGYIRFYNCLSDGVTMTPFVDGTPLTQSQIQPTGSRSGMYFKPGKHRLTVELSKGRVRPIVVKVPVKGQLTIVCFHLLDPDTQELRTQLFSLSDKSRPVETGYVPLRVKSLSRRDLKIDLGFDQLFIDPMGSNSCKKWKGQNISIMHDNKTFGNLISQGEVAHTILLWDNKDGSLESVIIDHAVPSLPEGLRKDLTFGPSRQELPYLRKMK